MRGVSSSLTLLEFTPRKVFRVNTRRHAINMNKNSTPKTTRAKAIAASRFEFQMLYGVRRDLQEKLRTEGWNVRVYIPFGTQWYPYLMRRLAERPANVWFLVSSLARR